MTDTHHQEQSDAAFDPSAPAPPFSNGSAQKVRAHDAKLLKPPGALGRLEEIAIWLGGVQATFVPEARRAAIIVFAADHGVTAQGVSPFPAVITRLMLDSFIEQRGAIGVLALRNNWPLQVVDVGVDCDDTPDGVVVDKLCRGTRDFTRAQAMTEDELDHALCAGARAVDRSDDPYEPVIWVFGDMGIGNTTAAAAVLAALTSQPAAAVAGPGTGLDADGVARKAAVIASALDLHGLSGPEIAPRQAVQCVGGLEIAAMAGAMIRAAQGRGAILVDGFIATVAALVACRINPSVRPYLLFAHRSAEPGHAVALAALEAEPLLDLGMRLGEGTGAALALHLVREAANLHCGMGTLDELSDQLS